MRPAALPEVQPDTSAAEMIVASTGPKDVRCRVVKMPPFPSVASLSHGCLPACTCWTCLRNGDPATDPRPAAARRRPHPATWPTRMTSSTARSRSRPRPPDATRQRRATALRQGTRELTMMAPIAAGRDQAERAPHARRELLWVAEQRDAGQADQVGADRCGREDEEDGHSPPSASCSAASATVSAWLPPRRRRASAPLRPEGAHRDGRSGSPPSR